MKNAMEEVFFQKYNRIICIDTNIYSFSKIPCLVKEYIIKSIHKNEKIIVITDNSAYREITDASFNSDNFIIGLYEPTSIDIEKLIELVNENNNNEQKIRIIWDFKTISKVRTNVDSLIQYIYNILRSLKRKNIVHIVYLNSLNCDEKTLLELVRKFQGLLIVDAERKLYFQGKDEIEKAVYLMQCNEYLRHQNRKLISFNDTFLNISRVYNIEEYNHILLKRMIRICGADFCLVYVMGENDRLSIGYSLGLTEEIKYYLEKNPGLYNLKNKSNGKKHNKGFFILQDREELENINAKEKLKELNINSFMGICTEYHNINKGMIWIGNYNDKKILSSNIKNIESICRTTFYLIEDQKRYLSLQNKLIETEKLKLMIETTAGIAHDMNNILTPAIGTIQLLKDMNIKNKIILGYIKTLEMCAYDGMSITNKMKTIANTQNTIEEMTIFNIDDLIIDAVNLTKNKWLTESALSGIKTEVFTELNAGVTVRGNVTEIREVFINLIRNAIDALPQGGNINISTNKMDNNVKIEISDDGIGMTTEILEKAFDPFFTTKGEKGSGLGLAISKNIVTSHKGDIFIESKLNKGTKFIITMPICKANGYDIEEVKKEEVINFSGDILIIDDQYQIRNVISSMIKSMTNCRIKKCDSVNLLSELERRKYDIIICDLCMPKIDGLEVAKLVKKQNKECYFCLMTGWIGNFDKNKSIDFILDKPINKEKIREMFINYDVRYNELL